MNAVDGAGGTTVVELDVAEVGFESDVIGSSCSPVLGDSLAWEAAAGIGPEVDVGLRRSPLVRLLLVSGAFSSSIDMSADLLYLLLALSELFMLSPLSRDVVARTGLVGREALTVPLLDVSRSLGRLLILERRADRVAAASALAARNAASSSSVVKALEIRGGEGVRSRIRLTLDMAAAGAVLVVAVGERGALIIVIHATAICCPSGMVCTSGGREQAASR